MHQSFEEHVHNEDGVEYWLGRELQELLGYGEWRNFEKVIDKAKIACKGSKQEPSDHFVDINKMIKLAKGAEREVLDIKLTREKLTVSEKELSGILFERGVDSRGFALIRSRGDTALFGGKNTQQMKTKLGIPEKRALADFLPTVTIKAKDLANEITNFNVNKDSRMKGEANINSEHVKNNKNMRAILKKSGIVPEDLPAEEDVKKVQRRLKSEGRKVSKVTKKLKK